MGQEHAPELDPLCVDRRQFIQVGAAAISTAFLEGDASSLALRADLLATTMFAPEAPLSEAHETDERVREHIVPLYNNLISEFGTWGGLFLEQNRRISTTNYSPVWPFSQALDAIGAARGIPGQVGEDARARYPDVLQLLSQYWSDAPAKRHPGYISGLQALTPSSQLERYIDDNLWIGLILVEAYQETGDEQHLASAIAIYNLAFSEWDTAHGGGLRWMQDLPSEHNGRVVASNAPAVMLGVQLALITGNPSFYKRGNQPGCPDVMDWMDRTLRDPSNSLYWDNINENGDIGHAMWTYNQGTAVGAKLWLHQADANQYPLTGALEIAEHALTYFDTMDDIQRARHDPKVNDGYIGNAFNAIFFRNLLALADRMPENIAFRRRVLESLHTRVSRLSHSNNDLLEQAGALKLAILAFQNPLDRPDTRAR